MVLSIDCSVPGEQSGAVCCITHLLVACTAVNGSWHMCVLQRTAVHELDAYTHDFNE